MTETEKIADVVVAAVRAAIAPYEKRVTELEARAPVPGPTGPLGPAGEVGAPGARGADGVAGRDGLDGKDGQSGAQGERGADGAPGRDGATGERGEKGLDGRDGQPGAPGVPGRDGAPGERGEKGLDGSPGRDGTLEGASLKQIDERTWCLVRADGSALTGTFKAPAVLDRGVYQAGRTYEKGDGATYGGSFWIAQDATSEKPGDGVTKWRLAVKCGRDGKDGKAGPQGPQGPTGSKGDPGRNYQ